jgi:hypothetical protein
MTDVGNPEVDLDIEGVRLLLHVLAWRAVVYA